MTVTKWLTKRNLIIALSIVIIILIFIYIIPVSVPIILALLTALLIDPLVRLAEDKFKLEAKNCGYFRIYFYTWYFFLHFFIIQSLD